MDLHRRLSKTLVAFVLPNYKHFNNRSKFTTSRARDLNMVEVRERDSKRSGHWSLFEESEKLEVKEGDTPFTTRLICCTNRVTDAVYFNLVTPSDSNNSDTEMALKRGGGAVGVRTVSRVYSDMGTGGPERGRRTPPRLSGCTDPVSAGVFL